MKKFHKNDEFFKKQKHSERYESGKVHLFNRSITLNQGPKDVRWLISKLTFNFTGQKPEDTCTAAAKDRMIALAPGIRRFTHRELEAGVADKIEGTIVDPFDFEAHPVLGSQFGQKGGTSYPKALDLLDRWDLTHPDHEAPLTAQEILEAVGPSERANTLKLIQDIQKLLPTKE